MKLLFRITTVLVLLVIVAIVAAVVMIDDIATAAVREGAAFATQTEVQCEKVDVKLLNAAGEIKNLDIKNPDGTFRETFDSFMVLSNGAAEISVGSILANKIVIPLVELKDIELSLVGLADGKKNYEVILQSLNRVHAENLGQKQIEITKLVISNIKVKYQFAEDPALGAIPVDGEIVIADDEPMVLENVGAGGVPLSQITADIITDILVQVMANLAGDLGGHMKGLAGSLVDTIGEVKLGETIEELDLGDKLDAIGDLGVDISELGIDAIEGIGEEAGNAVKGAGDAIRGLLDGDDED